MRCSKVTRCGSHLGQDGDGPDGKGVAGEGEAALPADPDLGRAVPGTRQQRPEPDIRFIQTY